jgi:putative endopeptidase
MNRSITVLILFTTFLCVRTQTPIAEKQDPLTADVDRTVSPRDDFYLYVNGGGFKRNSQSGPATNRADEEVLARERRIADRVAEAKAAPGSDSRLVGDMWSTGMDAERLNRQGIEPLRPDLDEIDRISSIRDLMDYVASLNMRSRPDAVMFRGYVWRDEENSDRWVYNIVQDGTTMDPSLYIASDPRAATFQNGYRDYLLRVFTRIYSDQAAAKESANAVYDLETRIAKAQVEDKYQSITVPQLEQLAPEFGWARYLRMMGIRRTDALVMKNAEYFKTVGALLRSVPLAIWKDYLRARLMRISVGWLDDRTLTDFFEYDRIYTGAQRPRDRWQRVMRNVEMHLGQPLARLFVTEYSVAHDKDHYRLLAESLRTAFRHRIQRSDWLSDATKQRAIQKLDAMKMTIGFPDKWADFSSLRLKRDSYFLNVTRANRWLNGQEANKVGTPVDRSEPMLWWRMRGDSGEYDPTNNELTFGAAALPSVSGVATTGSDEAMLYASLWVLGHEMSHGFDSKGRKYNASGTLEEWWTPADADKFTSRTRLLVDEYDGFSPVEGLHVDGKSTLAENMADLTGALIVLDAFKASEEFRKGESVAGFTPLQRFFIAFAHARRQQTPQEIVAALHGGDHSPARERVNGVLMNIQEFYEAFNLEPGDRMFLPEDKRVRIW